MTQLYRVLYCSRNRIAGDGDTIAQDIASILAASRENNARDGVTGGLLFSEGCFAQVLEGPLDSIEGAFERIQCDNRHSDVVVLQSGSIETRDFPDWSMAFAGIPSNGNPLVSMALSDAFSGRSSAGDAVLDVLKGVVVRETHRLAPTP
jgi:hypothetical protein